MSGGDSPTWIIACAVAVSLLVLSIVVCIICWCCKREAERDSISMKALTSNYSEPSDAIVPNNDRGSNYNYTNPFDKRGSDAGIIAVKHTNKTSKQKQKKKNTNLQSEKIRREQTQNYDYFTPYDSRKSKDGILSVKSSVKSTGKSNKAKTSNSVLKSPSEEKNESESKMAEKGDITLGGYIDVSVSNKQVNFINKSVDEMPAEAVVDLSNGYSDVSYKFPNTENRAPLRSASKRNVPDPYSVVHLDL